MKNEIDIQGALAVFNKITRLGEKQGEEYHLNGLTAVTGADDYSVELRGQRVCLNIYFHNKYHFDYPNEQALENFMFAFHQIENM